MLEGEIENLVTALAESETRFELETKETAARLKRIQSDILARYKIEFVKFRDLISVTNTTQLLPLTD